jgi:hypothetical protein
MISANGAMWPNELALLQRIHVSGSHFNRHHCPHIAARHEHGVHGELAQAPIAIHVGMDVDKQNRHVGLNAGAKHRSAPDFAQECRRQSRLAASADRAMQHFMDDALADVDGWAA